MNSYDPSRGFSDPERMALRPTRRFTRAAAPGVRFGAVAIVAAANLFWSARATAAAPDAIATAASRENAPPRKVVIGTVVSGYGLFTLPLEQRLDRMDRIVAAMSAQASARYPEHPLDLAILPETFLTNPGDSPAKQAVTLDAIQVRIAACAKRAHAYLVIPALLRQSSPSPRLSNSAILLDRAGNIVGIYRKVHPVAPQGSDVIEGGTTPGREFPVFACDFGRLGIQICFDMLYADGWDALAARGAEIVALPSASPETAHPSMYALQHAYYIVSATPRDHAAVYNPLGMREADATDEGEILVHQIDLSFALVHWDERLEEGAALTRRYGEKVGFHYYRPEDGGIFWSNDPATPIGRMLANLGLHSVESELLRIQRAEDQARGGPPEHP